MSSRTSVTAMEPAPGSPTPPIALAGGAAAATSRRRGSWVGITDTVLKALRDACPDVSDDPELIGEASRDWWPLAMTWARHGEVAARAAAVARPTDEGQVAALLAIANRWGIPVTAAGGRSGVCGASIPLYGGLVLDMCGLSGIRDVDDESLVVDVAAGTFGDAFEDVLARDHDLTCGHWPQSMALSTVGGWLACRGAGQMSTRYGKIEDIVLGLDVVLADGTVIHTGGFPAQSTGPDLTQIFVGSEGTLGVITGARLRAHPAPRYRRSAAYVAPSFDDGLDLCRRVLRRGATPAVLRLYDGTESHRNYGQDHGITVEDNVVIVLDEGDELIVDATMDVVDQEASAVGAGAADAAMVEHWLRTRNDVDALENLISRGFVVDTMEVTGSWSRLAEVYRSVTTAIGSVPGTMAVSAHCSHSYTSGGCMYFTFGGRPPGGDESSEAVDEYYKAVWNAGTTAALGAGASLAHHHGVGLNRGRFMAEALGSGADLITRFKLTLDPNGILNPGKLGLYSKFGPVGIL